MIWFAWRQTRAQIAVAGAATAAVAIVAAIAGRGDGTIRPWLSVLVVVVPGVVGVFWGAPLVASELESGSFRLAWTQDVSRVRWLAQRLTVCGLAAMAVAGLISWIVTWWAGPLDRVSLDQFGSFDSRGIVPLGYAVFAFMLGVVLGALLRRTVPAMAATLLAFTGVRVAFRLLARPYLLPQVTMTPALDASSTGYGSDGFFPFMPASNLQPAPPDLPNAWITSIAIVDGKGNGLTATELDRTCPGIGGPSAGGPPVNPLSGGSSTQHVQQGAATAMHDCVARIAATYHEVVTYQPAGRYWPLQWYELCIFVAASGLLAGACAWRISKIG